MRSPRTYRSEPTFLKAAITKITATVSENVLVELMNLGTFTMRPNAPRVGRNPSTGEPIDIPAKSLSGKY